MGVMAKNGYQRFRLCVVGLDLHRSSGGMLLTAGLKKHKLLIIQMIALLQRVSRASVTVESECIASIEQGLLVLLGVEKADTQTQVDRMAERILGYRLFADADGRMNLSVRDIGGAVLLVPQFTLAADTRRGMRPGFSTAASPETGRQLFDSVVDIMRSNYDYVATGRFGADMAVELVNDGPVTFWLSS